MSKDMNLTAQVIYEKEFQVDLKGYSPAQVDEFLDQVIEDYQRYDEKLEEYGVTVTRYETKLKELQQQIFALQTEKQNNTERVNKNNDQVDLLKRITRLEDVVAQLEKAVLKKDEEE